MRVIQNMYDNMQVKLQIGTEERNIPYTIDVQQGDNMAPVLFLFTMQAFAELLEKSGKIHGGLNHQNFVT